MRPLTFPLEPPALSGPGPIDVQVVELNVGVGVKSLLKSGTALTGSHGRGAYIPSGGVIPSSGVALGVANTSLRRRCAPAGITVSQQTEMTSKNETIRGDGILIFLPSDPGPPLVRRISMICNACGGAANSFSVA